MSILSANEIAALRVLAKRHIRLAARTATEPNPNVAQALAKLETLADGFPSRITSTGLRRLAIHSDETREQLIVEFDRLHDEIRSVAETFGVSDPGAACPGELMWELHDATHDAYAEPYSYEPCARALGL